MWATFELGLRDQSGFQILIELVLIASSPNVAVIVLTQVTHPGLWELAKWTEAYTCLANPFTSKAFNHHELLAREVPCIKTTVRPLTLAQPEGGGQPCTIYNLQCVDGATVSGGGTK
jgi:hypothetical protein